MLATRTGLANMCCWECRWTHTILADEPEYEDIMGGRDCSENAKVHVASLPVDNILCTTCGSHIVQCCVLLLHHCDAMGPNNMNYSIESTTLLISSYRHCRMCVCMRGTSCTPAPEVNSAHAAQASILVGQSSYQQSGPGFADFHTLLLRVRD